MILGVFGPWQVIALLCIVVLPIVGIILLVNSRAKHKGRAEAMKEMLDREMHNNEKKSSNEENKEH